MADIAELSAETNGAAAQPAAAMAHIAELTAGARVRTHGLSGRPDLDARKGEVIRLVELEGGEGGGGVSRYEVRLKGGDRHQPPGVFALPGKNLELLTEDEVADDDRAQAAAEAMSFAHRQQLAAMASTITAEAEAAAASAADPSEVPKFPLGKCEVRALPGKGFGVIATKALERGERVLWEHPLFRVTEQQLTAAKSQKGFGDMPAAEMMLRGKLTALSTEDRASFWSLMDCFGTEGNRKSAVGIVETNAIASAQEGTEPSRGVYFLGSRFNHNCRHNISRAWVDNLGAEVFHATRAVEEGEELCIQYCDPKSGWEERQNALKDKFLFDCDCKTCSFGENERATSDGLRGEYRKLDEEMLKMGSQPKEGLKMAERVLEIINLEFGGEPYLEQAACYACFQFALYSQDLELGRTWMRKAYDAKELAEGRHPGGAQWRAWAADPSQHRIAKEMHLTGKKVKPNEPCPCGGGRKYKKCCGQDMD